MKDLTFKLTETEIIVNYCDILDNCKEIILDIDDLKEWVLEKQLNWAYTKPTPENPEPEQVQIPIDIFLNENLDNYDVENFLIETQNNILYVRKENELRTR